MSNESSMQYLEGLQTDQVPAATTAKDPIAVAAQTLVPPSDKQRVMVATICLVLGFGGALSVCAKGYSFVAMQGEEYHRTATKGMNSRERKVYRKSREIREKYEIFALFEIIAHATVTCALMFGGFYSFMNRRNSAGFLATVCTAAIVFLVVRLLFNGWITIETFGVIQDAMPRGRHSEGIASALQFTMMIGLVFVALFVSVFIGFYVYAVSVLRRFQDFVDTQFKLYEADKMKAMGTPA